jgi:hypothetical protein
LMKPLHFNQHAKKYKQRRKEFIFFAPLLS